MLLLTLLCFLIALLLRNAVRKRSEGKLHYSDVPGPKGIPIFGYYFDLLKNPMKKIQNLVDIHGDIMKITVLGSDIYFLNTLDTVREGFVRNASSTADRIPSFNYVKLFFGLGLVGSSGQEWRAIRKTFFRVMSSIGNVGKRLEPILQQHIEVLLSRIAEHNNNGHDFFQLVKNFSFNVNSTFVFSTEYDLNDPSYLAIQSAIESFPNHTPGLDSLYSGPLFYLVTLFKPKDRLALHAAHKSGQKYFREIVDRRMKDQINEEANDVLGLFIEKHNQELKQTGHSIAFSRDSMADVLFETFNGVSDLTAALIAYALYMLAHCPKKQEQMYHEIKEVVGNENEVSLSDQSRLHYSMAVVQESLRLAGITFFGLPRFVTRDFSVQGYKIRKGASVVANYNRILKNPKHFPSGDCFDPGNFLDDDGHFLRNSANIAFSVGSRSCAGVQMTESTAFLCLVRLVQKFKWCPENGCRSEVIEAQEAPIFRTTAQKLIATFRH